MDAHRDVGEVPEEEWRRVLRYAGALAHRQWLSDGMITGEDVYMDKAMEVFCRCWRLYDPTKTSRFSTFFWKCASQELRHVRSRVFTLKRREVIGAEVLYPQSGTAALDESPILWAQVLARLSAWPRHQVFLQRLLAGESAADIARDEGYTQAAMTYRLKFIMRIFA